MSAGEQMKKSNTLGELKNSHFKSVSIKDEMRANLLQTCGRRAHLSRHCRIDDTVVPQIVNAILSKHNFILLGLCGQAKSRILRSLSTLLDPAVPMIAGCEINDDPLRPLCRACHELIEKMGDATPSTTSRLTNATLKSWRRRT